MSYEKDNWYQEFGKHFTQYGSTYKEIDTAYMQLLSIYLFMKELGYECTHHEPQESGITHYCIGRKGFRKVDSSKTVVAPNYISFNDAQRIHNGATRTVYKKLTKIIAFQYDFAVENKILGEALEERLVKKTYVQLFKNKDFKVQKKKVKLNFDHISFFKSLIVAEQLTGYNFNRDDYMMHLEELI